MNNLFCRMGWIIALAAGCCGVSPLFAQTEQDERPKPPAQQIVIVNLNLVFEKYSRAKALRAEFEAVCRPYQEKAKAIVAEIAIREDQARRRLHDAERLAELQKRVRQQRFELEEMRIEFDRGWAALNK